MGRTSIIVLVAAILSLFILMLLRSKGSRLYNRSTGIGLVLIVFPTGLAIFDNLRWQLAVLFAVAGLSVWLTNLFRGNSESETRAIDQQS